MEILIYHIRRGRSSPPFAVPHTFPVRVNTGWPAHLYRAFPRSWRARWVWRGRGAFMGGARSSCSDHGAPPTAASPLSEAGQDGSVPVP